MKVTLSTPRPLVKHTFTQAMRIGEIAKVLFPHKCQNHYILRTFDGFVDLNNPRNTWAGSPFYEVQVELLQPGEVITLDPHAT